MGPPETMVQLARDALERAYAPYSRFPVGVCLRTGEGQLFTGCNVENASFPEGWCAETSAIAAMVGSGGDRKIEEVVVMTTGPEPCPPCGGCRQRLKEFAQDDIPIHMVTTENQHRTLTLGELLPLTFSGERLQNFLP